MAKKAQPIPSEIQEAAKRHLEFIGETIELIEASKLPVERKLFFQTALLRGLDSQTVMDQLFQELEESNKAWGEQLNKLQEEVIGDAQKVQNQLKEYGEAMKLLRRAKQARRNATVSFAEQSIQEYLLESDSEQIEALRAKISSSEQ